MRHLTMITALGLGLTMASATMAEDKLVDELDVDVELEDVNANALDYYPNIERDLEAKLAEVFEPVRAGNGYDIKVRLSEISLDGSKLLGAEGEFNTLKGWVYIREDGNPDPVDSVGLSLQAKTGESDPNAAFVLAPGTDDFYRALIQRFAERTMEEVQGL